MTSRVNPDSIRETPTDLIKINIDKEKKELHVTLPFTPYLSDSEKTIVLATSRGHRKTSSTYENKNICIVLTAYIFEDTKPYEPKEI